MVRKKRGKIRNKSQKNKKLPHGSDRQMSKRVIAIIIASILFILSFLIIKPFLTAVLSGIILAYLLFIPYKKLNKLIKKPGICSAILCILTITIILLSVYFVAQVLIKEAFKLYISIQKLDLFDFISFSLTKLFPESPEMIRQITITLQQSLANLTNNFIKDVGIVLTNTPMIMVQFFVTFFIMFSFLKENNKIGDYIYEILPFNHSVNRRFIEKSKKLAFATIYGQIFVGILQGLLAGVCFYIFKVPSPLFFTLIAVFCGIIPFIGPWLVFIPVGLVMIVSGNYLSGILLIGIGIIVIGTIGTIVRSVVVGRRGELNLALALLGMFGGLVFLGPIGLIIGPLVLAYLGIFIEAYRTGKIEMFDKKIKKK